MEYKCFISRWKRETNVFLRVSHCLKVIRLKAQILESCPPSTACSQWDYLPIHTLGTAKCPRNESFSELPVLHRDTQGAMEHCTPWLLFPNRYVRCYHAVEHLPLLCQWETRWSFPQTEANSSMWWLDSIPLWTTLAPKWLSFLKSFPLPEI